MPPIALTDAQLAAVMRAAEPLAPADRSAFLETVAGLLQGQTIGDGAVARACGKAWQKFWTPPDLARSAGTSKWSRSRTSAR